MSERKTAWEPLFRYASAAAEPDRLNYLPTHFERYNELKRLEQEALEVLKANGYPTWVLCADYILHCHEYTDGYSLCVIKAKRDMELALPLPAAATFPTPATAEAAEFGPARKPELVGAAQ